MSIASGYGPNWTTAESWGLDAKRRVAELEQQLAAAQVEVRKLKRVLIDAGYAEEAHGGGYRLLWDKLAERKNALAAGGDQ